MPHDDVDRAGMADVRLGGLLGAALEANRSGRLSHFIVDAHSPAIEIFAPTRRAQNQDGDWYGEHAGKWLYAAAKSAGRTRDATLGAHVLAVADYLLSVQEDDGYLGTYAPGWRFMQPQPPKPGTWDGAPSVRTWDVWTHSYLILGLLEVHRQFGQPRHLEAARRIGDLCWNTIVRDGIDVTELGNHHGMSATVLLDPAAELYLVSDESRYLELAERILQQADDNPALALLAQAESGSDASQVATGKAYQLIWNLTGLAKLHKATGNLRYRDAVQHLWDNIRQHHLTLGGGPCGGVGHRSREVFNPAGVFSPESYVETCSTLAWIQLNRELLQISGDGRYAEEIERSAYNDLLGAQASNGEDWCYYVFPNGRRVHTTYWRCCKSSGAMALEELPAIACTQSDNGDISLNLYGPCSATFHSEPLGRVEIEQRTGYPFDGDIHLSVTPERAAHFAIRLRIPQWTQAAVLHVNGVLTDCQAGPDGYARIARDWQPGDVMTLQLPMTPRSHRACNRNIQESFAPDGSAVSQQVLRFDYLAITRGPLVFATGLIDGYKLAETVRVPQGADGDWLRLRSAGSADDVPCIEMAPEGRDPILFGPYYRVGERRDGSWRLTWLPLAPDERDA
ncbi:MAG: glycoside hydrolase family 127 protein [Luteimonas sp.]